MKSVAPDGALQKPLRLLERHRGRNSSAGGNGKPISRQNSCGAADIHTRTFLRMLFLDLQYSSGMKIRK